MFTNGSFKKKTINNPRHDFERSSDRKSKSAVFFLQCHRHGDETLQSVKPSTKNRRLFCLSVDLNTNSLTETSPKYKTTDRSGPFRDHKGTVCLFF